MKLRLTILLILTSIYIAASGCYNDKIVGDESIKNDAGLDLNDTSDTGDFDQNLTELCWVKSATMNPASDSSSSFEPLASDSIEDGAVVVVGRIHSMGTAIFGEGEANETTFEGYCGGFIAKYQSGGMLDWALPTAGAPDWVKGIERSGVLAAGMFEPVSSSTDILDASLVKYDANGAVEWSKLIARRLETSTYGSNPRYVVDSQDDGSIVVVAAFLGDIVLGEGELNETTLSSGGEDTVATYLAQFNADGTLDWAQLVESELGFTSALTIRQDGTIALFSERYINVYDLNWNLLWSAYINIDEWNNLGGMMWTSTGDLVIGGTFYGNLKIIDTEGTTTSASAPVISDGPTTTHVGELYVAEFDSQGVLKWLNTLENNDEENSATAIALDVDANDHALIAGNFDGRVTLGAGEVNETVLETNADYDSYIASYANDGSLNMSRRLAAVSSNTMFELGTITATDDSTMVVSGFLEGEATFNLIDGTSVTITSSDSLVVGKACP